MSTTVTYKGSTLTTVNNQTRTLKTAGKYLEDDVTLVDVSGSTINNQNKSVNPTESEQSVTYDNGYTGLGTVTVGAISSTYVGSGISRNDSDDLTVNGATITAAAGYYESSASKTVASGTAGTPTATKGAVSNHSISVTPSVTNTTGYITGSTKTGTAVTVSASELVSGTKSITSNGTGIDVTNYANVDVNVSGGGGGITADEIAMQTISGDISGNATYIGSYAFYSCRSLTTASFPNATYIGSSAFCNCTSLTTISFPNAKTIGSYAFYSCRSLTTASFPNATSISNYAFCSCTNLTTVSFSNATYIGSYAFGYCSSLTTASFSKATIIGSYAFNGCTNLTTTSFSKATTISGSAFCNCTSLTTISFPNAKTIGSYAFHQCKNLLSLYLLGSSLCTNGGATTFYNTPISKYTTATGGIHGSIFVPASLYNSYISATNWSVYSSRFVSLTNAEIEALSN